MDDKERFNILIIEDNLADIRLINEVLKESKTKTSIHIINDGAEALKYLHKKEKYQNKVDPDLILLDLNIPLIDGFEILKDIKANDKLKNIPVFVLTTSHNQEDFFKAYELQANCFMIKPLCFDEYDILLQRIERFWLKLSEK
jgi:two-component system, chemotaxis family, response regulator Rcp1